MYSLGLGQTASAPSPDLLATLEQAARNWISQNVNITLSPQTQQALQQAYIETQLKSLGYQAVTYGKSHLLVVLGIFAAFLILRRR